MVASVERLHRGGEFAHRLGKPQIGRREVAAIAAATTGVLTVDAMVRPRAPFDLWLLEHIQRADVLGLPQFFEVVEVLTSSTGAVSLWAFALIVFLMLRWWAPAIVLSLMPIGGLINEFISRALVERSRPHLAELQRSSGNWEERSFPSGHVTGAVLFWGLIFVVAGRIGNRVLRLAARTVSVVIIASVGFQRAWDGAHWPTDVLGAYALGSLLLIGLIAIYDRLDPAVSGLPFVHASPLPHREWRPHAHALTSLVLFKGNRVEKVYSPGFLPRAIYWLAFQAPFPYTANRAALEAAIHRRNLAAMLTKYWYGESRIAEALEIRTAGNRLALVSERVAGREPTDRNAARMFLRDLRARFEEAGLPTWQIDPRQPRAIDNLLEAKDGTYHIVDLESGLVSPLASLKTWRRAFKRNLVPIFDDVYFDLTRDYVAREETAIRAQLGATAVDELFALIDRAEEATKTWHQTEFRLWSRVLRNLRLATWRQRYRAADDRAKRWIDEAITTWEEEGRLTAAETEALRAEVQTPAFQAVLAPLGAHILVSIPLRFPLGSIVRPAMVIVALAASTVRLLLRRTSLTAWRLAWSIHSPLVAVLSAVPGFGAFAYLAAKPVRGNRLLMRILADVAMRHVPWNLYERSGLQRRIARPMTFDQQVTAVYVKEIVVQHMPQEHPSSYSGREVAVHAHSAGD